MFLIIGNNTDNFTPGKGSGHLYPDGFKIDAIFFTVGMLMGPLEPGCLVGIGLVGEYVILLLFFVTGILGLHFGWDGWICVKITGTIYEVG